MGATTPIEWLVLLIPHSNLRPTSCTAAPPNFISDIFFLTLAMSHYGHLKTIQSFNELGKHVHELQRHLERLNGDGSWMGVRHSARSTSHSHRYVFPQTPLQARTEAAINMVKVTFHDWLKRRFF